MVFSSDVGSGCTCPGVLHALVCLHPDRSACRSCARNTPSPSAPVHALGQIGVPRDSETRRHLLPIAFVVIALPLPASPARSPPPGGAGWRQRLYGDPVRHPSPCSSWAWLGWPIVAISFWPSPWPRRSLKWAGLNTSPCALSFIVLLRHALAITPPVGGASAFPRWQPSRGQTDGKPRLRQCAWQRDLTFVPAVLPVPASCCCKAT